MRPGRRAEYEVFKAADAAFRRGDLHALEAALGNPPEFPNAPMPAVLGGSCLQYAIYHSPLTFIRELLELGADPNYDDGDGFPSLIAALSSAPSSQHRGRDDSHAIIELLLSYGADVNQRGMNDHTPLHYAASTDDVRAVDILLAHGADTGARTRIDDYETPLELAVRYGRTRAAERLTSAVR